MVYVKCHGLFCKLRGLMFSRKKNLLFVFRREGKRFMHMLFVFFPIQIIWFNKDKEVVDFRVAYPFQPFVFHKGRAKYVLELSAFIDVSFR